MSEKYIPVTITLSDPQLNDEQLQEAVQNLRLEVEKVDGVRQADLIPVEVAPPGSKGLGGFLLGKFKALVNSKKLQTLVNELGNRLFRQTIEIEAEDNGRKLKVKISSAEDLVKVMPEIDKFIKG